MEADPGALRDAVKAVAKAIRSVPGAYACFIGGLAVQHHGYNRWTDDVDVVVDTAHFGEILNHLRAAGFVITQQWTLQNRETGAKLDLLREGVTLKNARFPLPHPSEMGPNTGYARLPWLLRLKLDAHRREDLADIVRIMRSHLDQAEAIAAELPEVFRKEFLELTEEARREMAGA